jgi:hypothetical protein
VNPAVEWLEGRISARTQQIRLSIGQQRGIGSVYVRPIFEVIDDLRSDRSDGYVCMPMDVDSADYQDSERWWL